MLEQIEKEEGTQESEESFKTDEDDEYEDPEEYTNKLKNFRFKNANGL